MGDSGDFAENIFYCQYRMFCIIIGTAQYGLAGQFFGVVYTILSSGHSHYASFNSIYELNAVLYGVTGGAIIGLLAGISLPYDRFMFLCTIVVIGLSAVA